MTEAKQSSRLTVALDPGNRDLLEQVFVARVQRSHRRMSFNCILNDALRLLAGRELAEVAAPTTKGE